MVMPRRLTLALALGVMAAACARTDRGADAGARRAAPPDSMPVVVLETSMGRIVMQFDRTKAPRTVDNIVRHLGVHFYDSLIFHRVVPGFVIQTGMMTPDDLVRTSSAPPVPIEADNGLGNVRGSVGLARLSDPNSGAVQFYVNLRDNPELDFRARTPDGWGYTVFGRVTEGMDVVDRIRRVPTGTVRGNREMPLEPIVVTRAYLLPADSAAPPPPR